MTDQPSADCAGASYASADEVDRASMARVYASWLGNNKDTYLVDQGIADAIARVSPLVVVGARQNRAFLARAVEYLAGMGVRQYLDIGSGLPSNGNVHEIAQQVVPDARTIYVDIDPVACAHARALLACDRYTRAIMADARDPSSILDNPAVREHLDFSQPVGVLFVAILHFISAAEDPHAIVTAFRDILVPGSHVVITHGADLSTGPEDTNKPGVRVFDPESSAQIRAAAELYSQIAAPAVLRTREEIATLFTGLDLISPGLVPAALWHPDVTTEPDDPDEPVAPILAGIGRVTTVNLDGGRDERGTRAS